MLLFPASATMPLRLYLDESGTLGFGGEVFTMAMVLVSDLAKLETSIARNKTTQAEIKASQMKTTQKLELAKKLLEENDLQVFLLTIDPAAAYACERKLDKELLYDSMIAQAMAYYLQRGELPRGRAYRLSLDMRGGIRESFEDMVRESIGNVLMHRDEPLVTDLQVRYMDSKYSAGVQVADLFSNIYRTTLSAKDSPCNGFLAKHMSTGVVHAGFSFGLRELADQMSQIAADLRARVEYEERNHIESTFRTLPLSAEEQFAPKTTLDRVMIEGEKLLEEAGRETAGTVWAAQADVSVQVAGVVDAREARGEGGVLASGQGEGVAARGGEGKVASSWTSASASETVAAAAAGAVAAPTAAPVAAAASDSMSAIAVASAVVSAPAAEGRESQVEMPKTLSRSARRRRSRAARKAADAEAALAVRLAMAADGGEPEGGNGGVSDETAHADAAGASVSAQMDDENTAADEATAVSQEGAGLQAAGSAESATDEPVVQDEQPVKAKRPGWRAKAQLEAKAEKTAARAKANAAASQGQASAEGDATPAASEGQPAVAGASEDAGDAQAAPKSKRRRSGRSRSSKAQEQAAAEKPEVPAGHAQAVEDASEAAPAAEPVGAHGPEVAVDSNRVHEGSPAAEAAGRHASEVVPAAEPTVAFAFEQAHESEVAAAPALAPEGAQAVVEGASGHTARERRQMAAQKSGTKKRTRKAKAAPAEIESVAPGTTQGESASAAVLGNGDTAAPAQVEAASEKAVPAGSQGGGPEVSKAPMPAAKPAAKRTRSRKAKAAPAAHTSETPAAPSGTEAVAAAVATTSAEVAAPTASVTSETPAPAPAPAPAEPVSSASAEAPSASSSDAGGNTEPRQDASASPAKPKAKRTRSRKPAAKAKSEVPPAE